MIQAETMLRVADNSGARRILCITPLGGGVGKTATMGDIISASVKEADPESGSFPYSWPDRTGYTGIAQRRPYRGTDQGTLETGRYMSFAFPAYSLQDYRP